MAANCRQLIAFHAAVGQHVQIDVPVLQQERVVPGLLRGLPPALNGSQIELLNDAHLVHLEGQVFAGEQSDVGHGGLFLGFGVVRGCWG